MDLATENTELKRLLWDTFCVMQFDILQVAPKDLAQFTDFIAGKVAKPPFNEGSQSYRICKLCGKL